MCEYLYYRYNISGIYFKLKTKHLTNTDFTGRLGGSFSNKSTKEQLNKQNTNLYCRSYRLV